MINAYPQDFNDSIIKPGRNTILLQTEYIMAPSLRRILLVPKELRSTGNRFNVRVTIFKAKYCDMETRC
jgi:hypothetical protein